MRNKFAKFAALAVCAGFASCSEYDAGIDPTTSYEIAYEAAFIQTFGRPAADQDWGFGSSETRAMTRAVDTWAHTHSDGWESKLDFPQTYDELIKEHGKENVRAITDGFDENIPVYYIPQGTTGDVSLSFNLIGGKSYSFYNFADINSLDGINGNGANVSFYNVGTIKYFASCNGGLQTVYNTGTLYVTGGYQYIGELYNNGYLEMQKNYNPWWDDPNAEADLPNTMSIYSAGDDAFIYLPDGADFKATCDIHHKISATGHLKIQNDNIQYICAVEVVDGTLEMTAGKLETSYIEADEITFDGAHIWLLPEGHIKAENTFTMKNSASEIFGYTGSHALIEAKDFYFRNQNNFADTFSDNIYFKVGGTIDIEERVITENGEEDKANQYPSLNAYLASQNGQKLDPKRFNPKDISAVDGCSDVWTIPDPEIPTNEVFKAEYRIIAEDLTATNSSDFDFNDIVFDVEYSNLDRTRITLKAAGGTLPLFVEVTNDNGMTEKREVHDAFGVSRNTMVNTNNGTVSKPDVVLFTLNRKVTNIKDDIQIYVEKEDGETYPLSANEGEPACKICVKPRYIWCDEREPVAEKYDGFTYWVQHPDYEWY